MTSTPILDTHIWIWWLQGDPRLETAVRTALDDLPPGRRPVVSDISLWEVSMLVSLGRLQLGRTLESWLQLAANPKTVKVWPITASIAAEVARLPETLQRDPADRIIVATCRNRGAPLLTHDTRIIQSGLVTSWTAK